MLKTKKHQILFAIILVYGIALLVASVIPFGGELNKTKVAEFRLDYIVHFGAYSGFYFLLIAGDLFSGKTTSKNFVVSLIVISLLLAIILETVQYFLAFRSFNVFDLIANLAGVAFGLVVYILYDKMSKTILKAQKS